MNRLSTSHLVTLVTWLAMLPVCADQRGQLWTEHVDLRVVYDPSLANPLSLGVRDEDHRILYAPTNVVLHVAEGARTALPSGTPFGERGEAMWITPQSQDPGLLYLGFSAEGLPRDVFAGPLRFKLISVKGPGGFAAWQAGAFGRLDVKFNSMDGIDEADQTTPIIGSHEHFNWGFKSPGVYAVTFVVEGEVIGNSTKLQSPPATILYHVHPLPSPTDYDQFAATLWHPDLLASAGAPDADPDGDGLSNAWEFYTGSNPCVADAVPVLGFSKGDREGDLKLHYSERDGLPDGVGLVLQRAASWEGPWEAVPDAGEVTVEQGVKHWTYVVQPSAIGRTAFFRVHPTP